jgi:hypothetical protein
MKKCINCYETKPLTEFYPKSQIYYQSWCKQCAPEVQKAWKKRKQQKDFSNWVRGVEK